MLKVSEESLEWALKHALRYHDTDILPFPFEFAAIEYDWARMSGFLQGFELVVIGAVSYEQRHEVKIGLLLVFTAGNPVRKFGS